MRRGNTSLKHEADEALQAIKQLAPADLTQLATATRDSRASFEYLSRAQFCIGSNLLEYWSGRTTNETRGVL